MTLANPLTEAMASWSPDQIVSAALKLGFGMAAMVCLTFIICYGFKMVTAIYDAKRR